MKFRKVARCERDFATPGHFTFARASLGASEVADRIGRAHFGDRAAVHYMVKRPAFFYSSGKLKRLDPQFLANNAKARALLNYITTTETPTTASR